MSSSKAARSRRTERPGEPVALARNRRAPNTATPGVQVAQLVRVTPEGLPFVTLEGPGSEPTRARVLAQIPGLDFSVDRLPLEVLVVIAESDPDTPIILGSIRASLSPDRDASAPDLELPKPDEVRIDGKRLVLDAHDEIVLRCGKSSVTLRKNGKVVVKGANLLSRASGANKIKGSTVNIN